MARGFGATLGASATTDIIKTSLTTHAATTSYWCWFTLHTYAAGGGFARLFDHADSTPTSGRIVCFNNNANSAGTLAFQRVWTTSGSWVWTGPSIDTWTGLGISYDESSAANHAIVYQAGTKLTVGSGLSETLPTGTVFAANGILSLGSRTSDTLRVWDGIIAEFAVWNAILTDGEFAALAAGMSPLMIRPQSLAEYVPMLRNNVSAKLAAPTLTGTAVQPHPRIIMPRPQQRRRLATAAAFKAAWSRGSNLPVLGTGNF